jgi:Domain of unknown function (DUF4157)
MSQRTMMQREQERETALTSVQEVLSSSGQPLDAETQNFMGARFGHDFSNVRVHTDERAGESAQAVNALAYTVGSDVVFDGGEYMPETETGRHLLAHELAHVVQQSRGGDHAPPPVPTHPLEQAAQQAASSVTSGRTVSVEGASAPGIARQPRTLNESLDPTSMSDADLAREIALIQQWLSENTASSPEQYQLISTLSTMETEVAQRNGQQNQTNTGAEQVADMGNGIPDAGVSTPSVDANVQGDSATLSNDGPALSTGEQAASFQLGGLPAFRYNAPNVALVETHVETPEASIDLKLSLKGSLTVSFQHSFPGISTDVDQQTFRLEAGRAVDGVFQGIRINGINGKNISFGATVGTEFSRAEIQFIPPNTMAFTVRARVAKSGDTPVGQMTVQGQPSFELQVTKTPHPGASQIETEVVDEESWFSRNSAMLAVIGVEVVLTVAAVALAPETGGSSLLPIIAE